jgi:SAM-dependent methyltransferase
MGTGNFWHTGAFSITLRKGKIMVSQQKQSEWHEQWTLWKDQELFLFNDWIHPNTLDDFKNRDVLEAGCGGGQHTAFVAPYAKSIVAVDLNTTDIGRERTRSFQNVNFIEADIATMNLERQFDVVFSIGVIHHTDHPDATVENLKRHVKPGGKLIIWVYAYEGNFWVRTWVEPIRKRFLGRMSRSRLMAISKLITLGMYLPIYTLSRLPLRFLPFYDYFGNFVKLSFYRNALNVFDKLNAPQVEFIKRERMETWFHDGQFEAVHVSAYKGVSWRGSGRKKHGPSITR